MLYFPEEELETCRVPVLAEGWLSLVHLNWWSSLDSRGTRHGRRHRCRTRNPYHIDLIRCRATPCWRIQEGRAFKAN